MQIQIEILPVIFTKLKSILVREHFFNIYLQKYGSILVHKIIIIIRNDEKSRPVCLYRSVSVKYVSDEIRVRKIKLNRTAIIHISAFDYSCVQRFCFKSIFRYRGVLLAQR